jgi:endophilin-B
MDSFMENASNLIGRTIQRTEEAFKTAEKTPIDPQLETLMTHSEERRRWATQLLSLTENVIRPNPAIRLEDAIFKGLERTKDRVSASEQLGESMTIMANEVGASTPLGQALNRCGNAESTIGRAEQEFVKAVDEKYIGWLRTYLDSVAKMAQKEREKLNTTRLDLDRAKKKLKGVKENDPKIQSYRAAVDEAQKVFDHQCNTTKEAQEKSISDFEQHAVSLNALLKCQLDYFQKCASAVQGAMS